MLPKDNIMSVKLDVAKPFLAELSMHTVRLNPGRELSACTIAQVQLKTSKAIHTIISDMWGYVVKKERNKSSDNMANLGEVESIMATNWQNLQKKKPKQQDEGMDINAGELLGSWEAGKPPVNSHLLSVHSEGLGLQLSELWPDLAPIYSGPNGYGQVCVDGVILETLLENSALHSVDLPPPGQHVDEIIDTVMISEDDAAGSTDDEATGDVHGLADVGGSGQGIPGTPGVLPATPGAITPGAHDHDDLEPEIGVGPMPDIYFGNALVEAPVAPIELDNDPDNEIPLAALPIQRRLLQVLDSNTKWVPKYGLRCKVPSGQAQWTKVYRARKRKLNAKILRVQGHVLLQHPLQCHQAKVWVEAASWQLQDASRHGS